MASFLIDPNRRAVDIDLGSNRLFHLAGVKGLCIQVMSGTALITFQNVISDIELHSGGTVTVPNSGLVLLEGFAACRIRITALPRSEPCRLFAFRCAWLPAAVAASASFVKGVRGARSG